MRYSDDQLDRGYFEHRAQRCWDLMDENERAAVRFGLSPVWTGEVDLGGKEEGHLAITGAEENRLAAVTLFEVARRNGGMVA